jgi:alpha-glucosidase (family GH31 glycosyl hydrolase)
MPVGPGEDRPWRDLAWNSGRIENPALGANQAMPMLVSSAGRALVSRRPFAFRVAGGVIEVRPSDPRTPTTRPSDTTATTTPAATLLEATDRTLRGAVLAALAQVAPPDGREPARAMFDGPQYNTWIETPYLPTQDGVLDYARRVLAAGFPPGVLMIDDTWAPGYGDWQFDARRFPDPAAMIDQLHRVGFTVMVWVVPYVSPDSPVYRQLEASERAAARAGAPRPVFLRDADGEVVVRRWWNGWSAMLDLTAPAAQDWFVDRLRALQETTGVDGFKFDGGDQRDLRPGDSGVGYALPSDQTAAYIDLGEQFPVNEFRASWMGAGKGVAERLHDKPPTWGADGLGSLVPEGIVQSLTGHAFTCPDMIGGGDVGAFAGLRENGTTDDVDREQFIRYAQCAALFPMMQFSLNPARILDADQLEIVRQAVALHMHLVPKILELARAAARTGEPILRPLAYHHAGYEQVTDQFLLGDSVLAAPVLERGARTRTVVLPPGRWELSDPGQALADGEKPGTFDGPTRLELPVTLASLPVFRRLD